MALEETPTRRARWPLVALGAAIAIAAGAFALRRSTEPTPCDAPEAELARAWSPELHEAFVQAAPELAQTARTLDRYAHDWLAGFRGACPSAARTACLLRIRDALAEEREILRAARSAVPQLPELAMCTVPLAPPAVPEALRDRVRALRVRARARPDASLVDAARALGWPPLVAEMLLATAERTGDPAARRAQLAAAVTEAVAAKDAQVEDLARLDVVALAFDAQDDPNDADEFARVLGEARAAIAASGDAPALRARLEAIEGERLIGQHRPRRALPHLDAARTGSAATGDLVRAARIARVQALALLATGGDGTAMVEDLLKLVRAASDRAAYDILVGVRGELAWRAGNYADAHGDDRASGPPPTGDATRGRVLDASGAPVADAIVAAWRGTLGGDALRIYARHDAIDGDVTTTARDGTFSLHVPPHGAIMAERGDQRSRPALAGAAPLELRLAPTTTIEGTAAATGEVSLATACAWYALDADTEWAEDAPIGKDGHFALANLPGPAPLCVRDDHHRLGVADVPSGRPLDVIVRGAAPGTRVVAGTAWGAAVPVGAATITDAGRALGYRRGDLHAVLDGLLPGSQEVCAVSGDRRTCVTVDMPRDPPAPDAKALAIAIPTEAAATGAPVKPSDGR